MPDETTISASSFPTASTASTVSPPAPVLAPGLSTPSLNLPNGMRIVCQTSTEARFFYEDIFEKRIYHRHNIVLDDVETVFDVGANIGMFALFIGRFCPRAKIYSCEAAPPIFSILSHNASSHGLRAELFNVAVTDREGEAELTFYPRSSGMSSIYADREAERRALEAIFENQLKQGLEGMEKVMEHSEDLLEERLRSQTFTVPTVSLSQLFRRTGVEQVDLLKIDVQRAEADVLAGIAEADWPRIRQIVIEVHDEAGRLARLSDELESRGFDLVTEQDAHYESSEIFNLYAARPREARSKPSSTPRRARDRATLLRNALMAQKNAADCMEERG